MSESVAKAPGAGIGGEKKRGISTFLFRRFGAIRAFATDLDKWRRRGPCADGGPGDRPGARSGPPRPEHSALPGGLSTVKNAYGTIYAQTMASATIAALPLTILLHALPAADHQGGGTTGLGGQ